jgi:hypothetical protein
VAQLDYFLLTATLTAIVTDNVDAGDTPDQDPISCTVEFRPRLPAGKLLWCPGLTPPQGLALPGIKARCDTDGVLRTIQDAAVDAQQTITVTINPSGSPFTMSFEGSAQSATIARNASAATVQTALLALSTIGATNVAVAGPNGGPWVATFNDALGNQPVPNLVPSTTDITVTTTRAGTLAAGVKLTAGTDVLGLGSYDPATETGGLVYDTIFTNVVYNGGLQDIHPFGIVALADWAGQTIDLATVTKVPPLAGL